MTNFRIFRISLFLSVLLVCGQGLSRAELVTKTVDGDTLEIEGIGKVRLIGVDTDESKPNKKLYKDSKKLGVSPDTLLKRGKIAYLFTRSLTEGKNVRVENGVGKTDLYGRTLVYIYLEDGTLLNRKLIELCYGRPLFYWPNTQYKKEFKELYNERCK